MDQPSHVSEGMPVHRWKPIEDLPADRSALDRAVAEVAALRRAWAGKKAELEASGALTEFNARLSRQWCIETGILEGIYTLDRGATTTLIEHGFDAALLSHGDTNVGELTLIQILRDHQEAIDGLFAFVKQDRPLSTSYIRQLHQALLAHQDHFEVLDGQGRLMRRPLAKGDWKLLPNNPGDPRTLEPVHEYSPPEETAAEMDRLVAMHATHGNVEAEISAAWLHHRYVQIHPFPDGNGRVARALATLVLIQKGGFPLVVLRDDKNAYIDALRAADDGDLVPFVEFVCRLQKKALLRAIEHGDTALSAGATVDAILDAAAHRIRAATPAGQETLAAAAESLQTLAAIRFRSLAVEVATRIQQVHAVHPVVFQSTGADDAAFASQVHSAAKRIGYSVPEGPSPWVLLEIRDRARTRLLLTFHLLGGVANSMSAAVLLGSSSRSETETCNRETFVFTADREHAERDAAFLKWLEEAIVVGLGAWTRSL